MEKTQDTLRDLIARAEASAGPDREIDAEIAQVLGWGGVHMSPLDTSICAGRPGNGRAWEHVPAYTASLDAALTLVPAGFWWETCAPYGDPAKQARASMFNASRQAGSARANTSPLALCAAALRARLAGMEGE
jgi:hypothetical protein